MTHFKLSQCPDQKDWESGLLFEVATPDLFRHNAFRVLGLPISATPREIGRRAQMLRMAAENGLDQPVPTVIFPVTPMPETQTLKESERKLSDASKRLIDELFWFWPLDENGADAALDALAACDYSKAISIWTDSLKRPCGGSGFHNLAIVYHLSALELEHFSLTSALSSEQQQLRESYWYWGMQYWRQAIENEGTWSFLTKRIRAIDDPSLTTGSARRIRDYLPAALLKINVGIAVTALLKGDAEEARKQIGLIRGSGFELGHAEAAAKLPIQRVRTEIKKLCDQAIKEAEMNPWSADKTTDHLLTRGEFLLWGTDNLLPAESIVRNELHGEITKAALSCQYEFGNLTGKWPLILKFFDRTLGLTTDPLLRQKIEEQSSIARGNQESQAYWCGDGYYDLPIAIYLELEEARELAENGKLDEAITALVDLYRSLGLRSIHKPLIGLPLAWGLNRRAVENLKSLNSLSSSGQDRKAEVVRVLRKSAYDLLLAEKLDSANSNVLGNLNEARQLFSRISLKIPNATLALMYFKLADETLLQQSVASSDAEVRIAAKKLLNGDEPDFFPSGTPSKLLHQIKRAIILCALPVRRLYSSSNPFHQIIQTLKNYARYWLPALGGLWIIANILLTQNQPVHEPQPTKSLSNGVATPAPTIPIGKQSQRLPLEGEIKALQAKITNYDIELTSIESQLEDYQSSIKRYREIINNCKRSRQIGEDVNEDYCGNAVETHNQAVSEHNSLLQKARAKQSARNQLVKQVNAKIDRYNSLNLNR